MPHCAAPFITQPPGLTWKKGGHNIAFHAYEIATATWKIVRALEELKGLIELVNRTWERRAEITPDTTVHQRPTPIGNLQTASNTNCNTVGANLLHFRAQTGRLAEKDRRLPAAP